MSEEVKQESNAPEQKPRVRREEIAARLSASSEYVFDPEKATPVKHNWIDRGLKMSCEGADHPFHQSFKQGGQMKQTA